MSEEIENSRQHAGSNAHPGIADANNGIVTIALRQDFDVTFRRSVFSRVVEEIGEHLSETHRITVEQQGFRRTINRQPMTSGLDERPANIDCVAQSYAKIDPFFF